MQQAQVEVLQEVQTKMVNLLEAVDATKPVVEEQKQAAEVRQEVRSKAANFREAAEAKKRLIEEEKEARLQRHATFEQKATEVPDDERAKRLEKFQKQETRLLRASSKVWSTLDFEAVRVIGRGSYGVVHLVRKRADGQLVALKQMPKEHYREKNLRERAFTERKILAESANRWFVELLATFQDPDNFYMVMEFIQGGDLLMHLERQGRFTHEQACFYSAELLQAIDVVHKAGFVHRDIKPDNAVLTMDGHLKLLDFGLCQSAPQQAPPGAPRPARRGCARGFFGTPNYMPPEATKGDISPSGDIWALGCLSFELMTGNLLFNSDLELGPEATKQVLLQVRDHKRHVERHLQAGVREGRIDEGGEHFLRGILCDISERSTAEECRGSAYFEDTIFDEIHLQQPPIIPQLVLRGPLDTRFFPVEPTDDGATLPNAFGGAGKDSRLEFANYEFSREVHELQQTKAVEAIFTADSDDD